MLVQITNQWQNLNTLSGITVGSAFLVQSQSSSRIYVKQSATQPADGSLDAAILGFKDLWQATTASPATWVRVADVTGQIYVEAL